MGSPASSDGSSTTGRSLDKDGDDRDIDDVNRSSQGDSDSDDDVEAEREPRARRETGSRSRRETASRAAVRPGTSRPGTSRDDEREELAADQLGLQNVAAMLADVPMFVKLDAEQLRGLAARVELVQLSEDELLFDYGDPGDYLMILIKGRVELSVKTKTGEKVFLELVEPREFFGEISLLDMGPRTAAARVTEAGEAIVVDRDDLDELLRLDPSSALSLLVAAGKRMRASAQILRNTATRNVNEQLEAEQSGVILRIADWVANFSGSIEFLILHMGVFAVWILLNVGLVPFGDFDPFPFGLLTMAVSLEAIMLSTLILFSSNRQGARDRLRGEIEYDVNLKAELQIQQLHEKVDTLHVEVLRRLETIDAKRQKQPLPPGGGTGGSVGGSSSGSR